MVDIALVSAGLSGTPYLTRMSTASLGAPLFSGSASAATLLRGGTWKPYDSAQSFWMSLLSTHSHFTYALASSTFLPLALTNCDQPPQNVAGVPRPASIGGQGTIPKSSPSAFLIAGIAHRPHHCIAASPVLKAVGSNQSVGAPLKILLLRSLKNCCALVNAATASSLAKSTALPSLVNLSCPADQRISVFRTLTPPSLPM